MELIHIFFILIFNFLSVMPTSGKPDPVKNIKVTVTGNTTKVSWQTPTQTGSSRIYLKNSKTYLSLDLPRRDSKERNGLQMDLPAPESSIMIKGLQMCSEYAVILLFHNGAWSVETEQTFWTTNNAVNANTNEDVALAWTTGYTDWFGVFTPSSLINIYNVEGSIIPNTQSTKYKYDKLSTDFQKINITIINVNETDAGLYITKGHNKPVDGCSLLVVTAKPLKPTLTLNAEHPFVGDNITFTCQSTIQRWPAGYRTSHLTYQFNGKPRGVTVNNKLTIHTLTMSDEGKVISCQATDDLQKASIKSDAVTLDPYYGPDNVMLEPGHTALNVTKGNILGPINCTATCNPKCLFEWRLNRTGNFVLSNETLVVANIKENQAGIYRCLVVHPLNRTRRLRTDISVNVQYSPKIESLWLSDKNETYGSGRHTKYSFNEGNHLTITLRIKSNPDPQIVINSSLMKFPTLLYTKWSDDFTTKLPSLKCENSGNFTIHASNGIAYGDRKTVNLEIKCKPRDVKTELKIGTKVNTDVNIVMNVVSFPAPNVTWLRMPKYVWTVLKDKYDYKHNISSTIRITSEDDFGLHGINICNPLGCIVENITLQPEDKPEAPFNFSVETTTFRSANLSWIVGFNGGHEQRFSIQYKTTDSDEDTKIVQTSDTKTGSKVYYILDQLKPDTLYHVMVLSTNKYGNRNASLELKTEVEPTVKSPSKSASMTPIFIGIGCSIAVILLIVITVYLVFNKRNKGSASEPTESNVLYAAVDKVQQKFKRRNTENEDANLSNEPANAEYASVVKPKSKSKKVHYKEDEIETANDEYAVVDKSNRKINFTEDDTTYANQGDADLLIRQPSRTKPSGRRKNKDGLTYIEVSFARKPKNKRVIIGAENRTNYVDIDFTRTADPLPETADE